MYVFIHSVCDFRPLSPTAECVEKCW